MKIKIAVLDQDKNYLERIMTVFNNRYVSETEIYLFTEINDALESLRQNRIQVFLANESFKISISSIPDYCAFAYLTEGIGINSLRGNKAICKYQKVESFYKEILSIYSDVFDGEISKTNDSRSKKIVILSASGGSGCTSCAIALAMSMARRGNKVFYLNLEMLNYGYIFNNEAISTLSEVIYNVKSRRSNLGIKLGALIQEDSSGIFYFPSGKTPLEVMELNEEDISLLIGEIDDMGEYDYIIIDTDMVFDNKTYTIINKSNKVVFVLDGSEIGNSKFNYMYKTLGIIEEQHNVSILNKAFILYNRFSSRTGKKIDNIAIQSLGGCPRYEGDSNQIIEQLSTLSVFDTLG